MSLCRLCLLAIALIPVLLFAQTAPIILYTDIISGPITGGENNKGIYLSIFGKNFGLKGAGTIVKVYLNNVEVDNYRFLRASKGRNDIQQLAVQLGAIGNPTPGTKLPIKVTVNDILSNVDKTFMVNPGRIFFFTPKGDDSAATTGSFNNPYLTPQFADLSKGAWGLVKPGDFFVFRAGTFSSIGFEKYFLRFKKSDGGSGTSPNGVEGNGPITLMGYPGEDAFINGDAAGHSGGCLSGLNGQNYPNAGKWITIADLRIEGGGYDGPISQEVFGDNWRIVNNELTAYTGVTAGASASRMAGITGNGANSNWLGNNIHDIQGGDQLSHGIYIDGKGSYEIAYNHIHHIKSGNGFQIYVNGGNGSDFCDSVNFHHNMIHDVSKHGINIADGSRNSVSIFNNVVYNTSVAGIRFNTNTLLGCKVWNNTFNNTDTTGNANYGAVMNDWSLGINALNMQNNIFSPHSGTPYNGGSNGIGSDMGIISNNLWNGGKGTFTFDASPITGDPLFLNNSGDFHIHSSSPAVNAGSSAVSSLVNNDFDILLARPEANGYDIGAYEYSITTEVKRAKLDFGKKKFSRFSLVDGVVKFNFLSGETNPIKSFDALGKNNF